MLLLLLLLVSQLLHPLELLLDTCRRLYGHHVLDLVTLNLPPRGLNLDGQLQFDLLGNRAPLLLRLGLDLSLDLGRDVGGQGRQQLDRLLDARYRDELMPDGRLDLELRLRLDLGRSLRLELDLELRLDLGLGLDLKLLR